jgi:hypothetical protein
MPVLYSPESAIAKELAKWNGPYAHQPFPRMVYRAMRTDDGSVVVTHPEPAVASQCQLTVKDQAELQRALESGWREHPDEAKALLESRRRKVADEAAHRAWDDRNMSDAAKAEAAQAEAAAGIDHVPEVKAKRRGRARKVA